ncbi:unnamed protein product [Allacma fusca]|uniref:Uncharacterized protein n=1 Tax=Allacma fusca TaxID=39272 RepID=A0A8J2PX37_9HEXA|nr:unnamed protein product [Allacma fusca]
MVQTNPSRQSPEGIGLSSRLQRKAGFVGKFLPAFKRTFEVVKKLNPVTYLLYDLRPDSRIQKYRKAHVHHLKPYISTISLHDSNDSSNSSSESYKFPSTDVFNDLSFTRPMPTPDFSDALPRLFSTSSEYERRRPQIRPLRKMEHDPPNPPEQQQASPTITPTEKVPIITHKIGSMTLDSPPKPTRD